MTPLSIFMLFLTMFAIVASILLLALLYKPKEDNP